jgi:hypothetical protein
MAEVSRSWDDKESAAEKVRRPETGVTWTPGKKSRTQTIPNSALFRWMLQPRPRCGPRKRWSDMACRDLPDIEVEEPRVNGMRRQGHPK